MVQLLSCIIVVIYPSALVIFSIICITTLIVKKGFCSWVCHIGMLLDSLSTSTTTGLRPVGFNSRTESPAIPALGRLVHSMSNIVIEIFFKMVLKIFSDHVFRQFSRSHTKISSCPKCRPQYRFFMRGNSSNILRDTLPP